MKSLVKEPEQTRRKILRAAFEEFYKNGFQAGSLNHIVDSAGATKGALFHHFKDKAELGYAVVSEVVRPYFKQHWMDPLANSIDPIADLKRVFGNRPSDAAGPVRLEQGCPLNNLALEMSPLDERFRQCIERVYVEWRECLEAALGRGVKSGKVRKDVSPRNVSAFIAAAHAGIMGMAKNAQSRELMRQANEELVCYLDGLKP